MLRNLDDNKSLCGGGGNLGSSKCKRELRKLECTINYNSQGSGKTIGRDKGNLLLKLK